MNSEQQTQKLTPRPKNTFKNAVTGKKTIDEKLDLIIDKIVIIDEKLTKVSDKLDTLENQFKSYVKRESDIQEATVTEYVYQTLKRNFKFSTITKHSLHYFFLPNSPDQFTDIDGCLIYTPHTPYVNGNISTESHAILIEAKHALTKALVNYKIFQFCKIKSVLQDIKKNTVSEKDPSPAFQNMVLTHNLQSFPDNINFFFASDDLSYEVKEYIYKISTLTLTEEEYDAIVFDSTKRDYNRILEVLDYKTRKELSNLKQSSEIYSAFFKSLNISKYDEDEQKVLHSYMNLLTPFSIAKKCFEQLENTLGIVQFGIFYQFQEGKDMENTSLFGYDINQGANAWNFAKVKF